MYEETIGFCFDFTYASFAHGTGCVRGRTQPLRAPGTGACLGNMDGDQRLSHVLLLLLQRSDGDVRLPKGI